MLNLHNPWLPIMTVSLLTLTACSTIDDDYEPTEGVKEVLTDLQIAISSHTAETRQTGITTQAQEPPVFRGIQDIYLIPYSVSGNSVVATDYRQGMRINLPQLSSDPSINSINGLNTNNNSRYYTDVEMPLGTNAFLFYGRAIRNGNSNFVNGLTAVTGLSAANVASQPSGISFGPSSIVTDATSASDKANNLAACLTAVAGATGWSTSPSYVDDYNKFITMTAGSSASICALLQGVYNTYKSKTEAVPQAVVTAILTYADVDANGILTMKPLYADYPGCYDLPDGAAFVKWIEDTATPANSRFEAVVSSSPAVQQPTGLIASGITAYAYPAELYYRVNSKIKTDDTNTHADDYLNTTTWDGAGGLLSKYPYPDATHPGTVNTETKSIAIIDQVQYAVARLDLSIETAVKSNSADGNGTLRDAADNVITVGSTTFPIKGILIGNQRPVDFEFHPKSTTERNIIYDTSFGSGTTSDPYTLQNLVSGGTAGPNYTLVYETPKATGNDDANAIVNFAIELENRSNQDFVGVNNMVIPVGTRFYLIGQINPMDPNKTGSALQVFKQDCYTIVTATISSLANAYNVIPDISHPTETLTLGIEVIDWKLSTPYSGVMR